MMYRDPRTIANIKDPEVKKMQQEHMTFILRLYLITLAAYLAFPKSHLLIRGVSMIWFFNRLCERGRPFVPWSRFGPSEPLPWGDYAWALVILTLGFGVGLGIGFLLADLSSYGMFFGITTGHYLAAVFFQPYLGNRSGKKSLPKAEASSSDADEPRPPPPSGGP